MALLPKPDACHGCPLYGDGMGFVPDELRDVEVAILAQNPGENEEEGLRCTDYGPRFGRRQMYLTEPCRPAPLIGPTGFLLEREFLPISGLSRDRVSLCNVLKCRLQYPGAKGKVERTNDMPTGKTLDAAIEQCTREHLRFPAATKLVVAMGAHAWRFMQGPQPLTDWRGFLKPCES